MQHRLPKFKRAPDQLPARRLTDRSLAVLDTIARYQILPTSLLVSLVQGATNITHRHLQLLFHRGLVNRFSFPRVGNPGEFHYYLDNTEAVELIGERLTPDQREDLLEQVRRNKAKRHADVHDLDRVEEMQGRLLFLKHEVMISRFHGTLELACRGSGGSVELEVFRQGPSLWHSVEVPGMAHGGAQLGWEELNTTVALPHRPDAFFTLHFPSELEERGRAHFFYEADRKTTSTTKFAQKLRAHFHYIVKQRRQEADYGVRRIRAVLVESLDPSWAETLRVSGQDPVVGGSNPSPLFWFTTSTLFTELQPAKGRKKALPRFLAQPAIVFDKIWASPADDIAHSLLD